MRLAHICLLTAALALPTAVQAKEDFDDSIWTSGVVEEAPSTLSGAEVKLNDFEPTDSGLDDSERDTWPSPPPTVQELDLESYAGNWFQVLSSLAPMITEGTGGPCVTHEYRVVQKDGERSLAVRDDKGVTGHVYRNLPDKYPGEMRFTHSHRKRKYDAFYWVVALGPVEAENSSYEWSIVSDPLRMSLTVLARDPDRFHKYFSKTVFAKLEELGFTQFYNKPRITKQGAPHCDSDLMDNAINSSQMGERPSPEGDTEGQETEMEIETETDGCTMEWNFLHDSCWLVAQRAIEGAAEELEFRGSQICRGREHCGYHLRSEYPWEEGNPIEFLLETVSPYRQYDVELHLEDVINSITPGCRVLAVSKSSEGQSHQRGPGDHYCSLAVLGEEAIGLGHAEHVPAGATCHDRHNRACGDILP